jgi:exodeoxyribonuclease VII small subunit
MARSGKKPSFEEAMSRLDEIVEAMESGEIGIEESIARYEEAMKLAQHCRRVLDSVEQRIQKIQAEADELDTAPFEPSEPPASDD